ncbi:MAG TPA: nucleotidyltransferase family protein [Terriglobia bacterium]|nr:nucleotidyltransferase family protein [Terriglobia bacterium]
MTAGPAVDRAKITGLVLAAGESSRMGRDKALLDYRGRTFLETIILKLVEAGLERVIVVLGHHAEDIQRTVDLAAAEVMVNRNYLDGQTSSLQTGLAVLDRTDTGPDAIILCLVDHPAFQPATVCALIEEFDRSASRVIIPTYEGWRGHPVLIARPLFAPLLALPPDQGANTAIRASRCRTVDVPDPGILVDVDDPETYRALE